VFPFPKEEIENLSENNMERLAAFDAAGLLAGPGETIEAYRERIIKVMGAVSGDEERLKKDGLINLDDVLALRAEDRISPEIMREAASETERLFAFSIDWIPGFFCSASLGFLWGGCSVHIPEESRTLFLVRGAFASKSRWLVYDRSELLAHELCHSARAPLNDMAYEEHFAYMTSNHRLRRVIGNCFRRRFDALFFLGPVFLVFFAQLIQSFIWEPMPVWPFWIFLAVSVSAMLTANSLSRRLYFKAEDNLRRFGVARPAAVLFRCLSWETRKIASLKNAEELNAMTGSSASSELRWKIIKHRFLAGGDR
jgi:hypothetical protein